MNEKNEDEDLEKWHEEKWNNPDWWDSGSYADFSEKTVRQPWEDEIDERARRIQQEKWSKQK